jgi:histidyl-tRNA synthetase
VIVKVNLPFQEMNNDISLTEHQQSLRILDLIVKVQKDDIQLEDQIRFLSEIFRILNDIPNILRTVEEIRSVVLTFISDFRCLKQKEDELAQLLLSAESIFGENEGEFFEEMQKLLQALRTIQANMDSVEQFIHSL